ncbi:methylthioribose-1-phosphate isomerase [Eggerthella sp. CAG:1427]|nr:methylthioribose-1-phosphate isomerase [Eggerthella sp. CAG:1427]
MSMSDLPRTITLLQEESCVLIVDQTKLPYDLTYSEIRSWERMVDAIKRLEIRGAPALGVAGAAAVYLYLANEVCCSKNNESVPLHSEEKTLPRNKHHSEYREHNKERLLQDLDCVCESISNARPTAVNLSWGVSRAQSRAHAAISNNEKLPELCAHVADEVIAIIAEDEACCRSIGSHGAALLPNKATVLTHCNAGSLATAFYGTALGVIYCAFEQGKIERVFADETRPVGQGARLTAWELARAGVPATLICDNMAASLMASGVIDAIVVGADRICSNGDTANKIGTYNLAVLAHYHHLPFYIAAPTSTIDWKLSEGFAIEIEQRATEEVLTQPIKGVDIYNPAFDVTPGHLITAFITEKGVVTPQELRYIK